MDTSGDSERNGADRFLDLAVYAPLGLALEFRKMFPDLAERGRRQLTFTKSVGKMAVTRGGTELRKRMQTEPDGEQERDSQHPPAPAAEPESEVTEANSMAASADVVIADYDSLSAQHVVRRLDGLDSEDLEAVRSYEELNRGRRTILTKIAQLQE